MTSDPVLTIVTPTYNRADYLAETIESVLSQNFPSFEYIIIDDGSTDRTAEVVKKYLPRKRLFGRTKGPKITYLRHKNVGETQTVNRALRMARGEFFTIVNSDDPLLPDCLNKVIGALRDNPKALAAYPDWHVIGTESEVLSTTRMPDYDLRKLLSHGAVSIGPGACFRHKVLEKVGYRNPLLRYAADLDFWYRIAMLGQIEHVREPLATHRVHADSASISNRGPRLANETAYLLYAYSRHPSLDQCMRRLHSLAIAHSHYAAAFACSDVRHAARELARGFLAHPVGMATRCGPGKISAVIAHFVRLGAQPRKGTGAKFGTLLKAQSRLEALRPTIRAILSDPIGMLIAADQFGVDKLIDHLRKLPTRRPVNGRGPSPVDTLKAVAEELNPTPQPHSKSGPNVQNIDPNTEKSAGANGEAVNGPIRSNVEYWQQMQEKDYFEHHPCYKGLVDTWGDSECGVIEWFLPLKSDMKVVNIGCGYGREAVHIARKVQHVYGIDVSERILNKARAYVAEKGVTNFTPILAENYKSEIPSGIDLVFSIVVMQHLTRDLVKDYLTSLGAKLKPTGKMVIQFLEALKSDLDADAELKAYEPSISWSIPQIVLTAREVGLKFEQSRSFIMTDETLWHWTLLSKEG